MTGHLPEHADAFMGLIARVEHFLTRNGYARANRPRAEIDWVRFADELGEHFFHAVRDSQRATTLIAEPPRVHLRGQGFQPEVQEPVRNVIELFQRGVCQVRNNIAHGEKYVVEGSARDDALVKEAHWVLEQAIARHPRVKVIMAEHVAVR